MRSFLKNVSQSQISCTCGGQDGAVQGVFQRFQSFTFMDDRLIRQLVISLRSFNELPPEIKDSGVAHLVKSNSFSRSTTGGETSP